MAGSVLYYPWIDVDDVGWLKTAVLFWDEIFTLVPEGHEVAYRHPAVRAAADAGILRPLPVRASDPAVASADRTLQRSLGIEWAKALRRAPVVESNDPFTSNWRLSEHITIHENKLVSAGFITEGRKRDGWIRMRPEVAAMYLTALAVHMADERGLALYTGEEGLSRWAEVERLGSLANPLPDTRLGDLVLPGRDGAEIPAEARRVSAASTMPATLASLTLSGVTVDPALDMDRILDFRAAERQSGALGRCRVAVDELAAAIGQDDSPSPEALKARITDCYTNRVLPALGELTEARRSVGWQAAPDLLKAAVLAPVPASVVTALALNPLGGVLLAAGSAAVGIAAVTTQVLAKRRETLRGKPFSFAIHARDKFGHANPADSRPTG